MRVLSVILLMCVAALGCGSQPPDPAPLEIEGMRNAVVVGDLLFAGQPTDKALAELAKQGYRTILSTRGEGELMWNEQAIVEPLGMSFFHIPMNGSSAPITDEQVAAFADIMENAERPMVLHCASGNRVSGLWAVWLVEHEGKSPEEALAMATKTGMTRVRPVVEKRLGVAGE